jgi:hypothetical protein
VELNPVPAIVTETVEVLRPNEGTIPVTTGGDRGTVALYVTVALDPACPSLLMTVTFQAPAGTWRGIVPVKEVADPTTTPASVTLVQSVRLRLTIVVPVELRPEPAIVTETVEVLRPYDGAIPVTIGGAKDGIEVYVTVALVPDWPSGLMTVTFQVPAGTWVGIVPVREKADTTNTPVRVMLPQSVRLRLTIGVTEVLNPVPVIVNGIIEKFRAVAGLIPATTGEAKVTVYFSVFVAAR